jgi:hypothetical protein
MKLHLAYHNHLNKKLFDAKTEYLHDVVREKLLRVAKEFLHFAKVPDSALVDIVLVGSASQLNYTTKSDLDLHTILDFSKIPAGDFTESYLQNAKALFNTNRDIRIHKYKVEVYPQSVEDQLVSAGMYSLVSNQWLTKPLDLKHDKHLDAELQAQADKYTALVDEYIANDMGIECLQCLKNKLHQLRVAGLASDQKEESLGNRLYKELRYRNVISKIIKYINRKNDQEMGLSEQEKHLRELWNEMILMKVENGMMKMLEVHYPQPQPRVSSLKEILASHVYWDGETE